MLILVIPDNKINTPKAKYQNKFETLFTSRNPANEKKATSSASVVLLSIHLITVDELAIQNRTIKDTKRLL
jgi:hypothetical protein